MLPRLPLVIMRSLFGRGVCFMHDIVSCIVGFFIGIACLPSNILASTMAIG